jgi:TRAP-type mannitol/chloroaromatic compound transport system permease small subunit
MKIVKIFSSIPGPTLAILFLSIVIVIMLGATFSYSIHITQQLEHGLEANRILLENQASLINRSEAFEGETAIGHDILYETLKNKPVAVVEIEGNGTTFRIIENGTTFKIMEQNRIK